MNGSDTFVPYSEFNWVHNTHAYGSKYGAVTDWQDAARDTAEMKFGMEFSINDSLTGFGQFSVNLGDEGYNRREGSFGLKYRF